jgi:asparagine synthase (glutamine-hydrolysing)
MDSELRHRGPDVATFVDVGQCGFGYRSHLIALDGIAVAPNGLAIVLDGRIDNRRELHDALGCANPITRDCELVLQCYVRWGNDCAQHLLGDFAFAIWDSPSRTLLCARDQFGVRPFYYYSSARLFAFASEPQALCALVPAVREEVNEAWLALYVAGSPPPPADTIYTPIKRLPPGHKGLVAGQTIHLQSYYDLESNILRGDRRTSSEHAEKLASILEVAIACRIEGQEPAAAFLSGGLDSSSIVTLAAKKRLQYGQGPLKTFSMVYPDTPEHDERPFIDQVIAAAHVDPLFLDCGHVAPFLDFESLLSSQAGPFLGPNLPASSLIHELAARAGAKVVLDGHGGDETISYGAARIPDLAFNGQWIVLWKELRALCAVEGLNFPLTFIRVLAHKGPHRRIRRRIGAWVRRRRGEPGPWPHGLSLVNDELAKRTALSSLLPPALPDPSLFGREERHHHLTTVQSDFQSYAFELLDRAAAHAGIELRFPFWDRRLVEYCAGLSSAEKMRDGFTRSILRRAMAHRLPDSVRWRPDKLDFSPHISTGMLDHHIMLIDDLIINDPGKLSAYVNLARIRESWSRLRDRSIAPLGADIHAVWRAAALAIWLRSPQASFIREEI